jgi:hypothetical protein
MSTVLQQIQYDAQRKLAFILYGCGSGSEPKSLGAQPIDIS